MARKKKFTSKIEIPIEDSVKELLEMIADREHDTPTNIVRQMIYQRVYEVKEDLQFYDEAQGKINEE